jgi:predicted CoA-binding protein|tara:strand:- start:254 stop:679 length:426 start_codon:yes stop_codon:yes gene_type:complete
MEKQIIDDKIKELFISSRVIALVGASNNKEKDSNKVMKFLQRAGYRVIPVNPTSINSFIYGEKVYGSLADIKEKVDIVDVFRPSKEAEEIATQTIKIGANVLWLQLDIQSNKARDLVMKNKIYYVANKCTKIEFERLFRGS